MDAPGVACDALLSDGTVVHVRPIKGSDEKGLLDFHSRLSSQSVYLRFFSAHAQLRPEEVHRFTHVDGRDRMALVATLRDDIIAVARYDRLDSDPEVAEVAFVVVDEFQGRGLATLLLEMLAAHARTQGLSRFRADTLWENTAMRNVFRDAGFEATSTHDADVVNVEMDISLSEAFVHAVESRDEVAEAEAVRRLMCPESVAVIGASRTPNTIGHELVRNIVNGGYTGPVYPIHPSAAEVAGLPAYRSVQDVPGPVDLAVVAVPASAVPAVVEECAAKQVKDLVLITAGFAEVGDDGRQAQQEIVTRARWAGMRLVGPNCMGIINTSPTVSLNATFAPVPPEPGRVGFASQSGGLGIAVLEEARRRRIGLSSFVSLGNKADISGNDMLLYWKQDPATDVVLLYLESFGNPRRFARIARSVSAVKPIVAVKAGRSSAGQRAAASHTAALASPDAAVDALFHQAGVVRVDTLEEMFDVAQLLADQPIPAGRRVAVIGNAGGPGILAADACEAYGLILPELGPGTQQELRSFLPGAAAVTNPVDLVASASPENYERALDAVLSDEQIDAVVAIFVPPLVTDPTEIAKAIASSASRSDKPIVADFLGMSEPPEELRTGKRAVPNFTFPEPAVRALAHACGYGEWRSRDAGQTRVFDDVDASAARRAIGSVLAGEPRGRWLEPAEANLLLRAYRIPVPALEVARTPEEAAAAASRIGYPVALKAAGPRLIHKTELGAVVLALETEKQVFDAFTNLTTRLGGEMDGAVVQQMIEPGGVETIIGVVQDDSFGPLVMFGTGGTAVELFADRAFRILPMTDTDAHELVNSVRGAPLLTGYRGAPPADVAALETMILRVAQLAQDHPEVAEMDINPVICGPWGVSAVDVKIRVAPVRPRPDTTVRRLR